MPITSIFDLIPNCPNPAPINVVPFFDGCNWSLIQIPAGTTCNDVLACFTNNPDFIWTLLTSANGSIVIAGNNIEVSTAWLDANVSVSLWGLTGCDLTIGTTTIDLCSIFSNIVYTFADAGGVMMDVGNGDTINVLGVDGMRFFITPANTLNVGLPANRQHMQVLTWDDVNHVAYRENNQCCAQTLSFDTATNLLSISGTNSVDLTSINTDNQELAIVGNILSITQLNSGPQAVDLTNVNEHTLWLVGNLLDIYGSDGLSNDQVDLKNVNEHTLGLVNNLLSIYGSDGIANAIIDLENVNEHTLSVTGAGRGDAWETVVINIHGSDGNINNFVTIPRPLVATCTDVMACPDIQTMLANMASMLATIGALQNQVTLLQGQLP